MAAKAKDKADVTGFRSKWDKLISKAKKDDESFLLAGDKVVDQYRIESRSSVQQDKYNILYSNTETIKPSLYSQTPKPQVQKRDVDVNDPIGTAASLILEKSLSYQMTVDDFDEIIFGIVEDFLLPGRGIAWCRYVPTFKNVKDDSGGDKLDADGNPLQVVSYERVGFDYVNWKDFLTSKGRRWSEIWWVARRVYMDKEALEARFGREKADNTQYTVNKSASGVKTGAEDNIETDQAEIWEIWDKRARKAYWYCETYSGEMLDTKDDPLKLENFFPCPRPLRAITTTNKFEARPFYAQYQAQADELNDLTHKIRRLVDALRVIGVYDASADNLKTLLTGTGNKMIPVENWNTFSEKGGLRGTVDFVPITEVAAVLMQLYQARNEVKNEIYEITGWSDIIRGASKASETLGAQQIKTDWASARLKLMQREVQRFVRDLLRIGAEIICKHFNPETVVAISDLGLDRIQDQTVLIQVVRRFQMAWTLLKSDSNRSTTLDIETDSTLLPDEQNDQAQRMQFLTAAGAFLQQAVPAMQAMPAMAPLLAETLMFAVRSFRAARPLEDTFEKFTQGIESGAVQPPPQQQGGQQQQGAGGQASAQASVAVQQMKNQQSDKELAERQMEHSTKLTLDQQKEQNRHLEQMGQLRVSLVDKLLEAHKQGIDLTKHMSDSSVAHLQLASDHSNAQQDRQTNVAENAADRTAAVEQAAQQSFQQGGE